MDTTRLRELTEAEGPFASVYLDDSHDTADAGKQLELKRREIRETLAAQGAANRLIEAVDEALRDREPPVGRSGRAVLAARDGEVLIDERLAEPPGQVEARCSELPHLVPLFAHSPAGTPYLLVITDQTGADLTAVDAQGHRVRVERVEGSDHPVHKARGGGEAHRDIQNRVEETVKRNLDEVAAQVAKLASATQAELIVLAGEVQSRRALREQLPLPAQRIATEVTGGAQQLDTAIGEVLAGRRLARLDSAAQRFRAELGRGGLAVGGLEGVTTALREANVETLLLTDPGDAQVNLNGKSGRADEALPVAALAVGAEVVVLDERLDLAEGVGAILRHN